MPMIVPDCIHSIDERSVPYLGNVQVTRMESETEALYARVAGRRIDEVLLDFLWDCRIEILSEYPTDTVFRLILPNSFQ